MSSTHDRGMMHQLFSKGWCPDCRRGEGDHVHHLTRDIELGVLTWEVMRDPGLRKRLEGRGPTAELRSDDRRQAVLRSSELTAAQPLRALGRYRATTVGEQHHFLVPSTKVAPPLMPAWRSESPVTHHVPQWGGCHHH